MFIQTEPTPNPATLKFLPGTDVMVSDTAEFSSAEAAAVSPLATRLFAIEGVAGVFLGADFISVAKADDADWQVLKPQLLAAIMDHFSSGQPVIESESDAGDRAGDDDPLVAQIKDLIETRVRPAVAQDGGDIIFRDFRDGIVYLHLRGACSGCPSASATLKHGIENMLKYYVPEVVAVQAVV